MKNLFNKNSNEDSKYHYTRDNQTKLHLKIIRLIAIVVFVYSAYSIIMWQKDNSNTTKVMQDIYSSVDFSNTIQIIDNETGAVADVLDFTKLKKKNSSTVAWIKVNKTNIDYPVVQYKNNDYYLNHSFDTSKNSAGWIFLDCKTNKNFTDKNTVIYGHNRKNGSMFSTLQNVLEKDWYSKKVNQEITLYTPEKTLYYQVFSVYKVKTETYYTKNDFKTDEEYQNFLNKITKRSVYDFKTDVTTDDKLLTLSTCDDNKAYRIVLHAKLMN